MLLATTSCGALPLELNLSPFYRHRLDADRSLLELDVAWPIVHYERTPTGGDDLRLRPLWRRVREGERVEHQFLWPFGRIEADAEEVDARLFPLWTYRWRLNGFGQREVEWEAPYPLPILPFVAGGTEAYEDGSTRTYFGINPIYAELYGYLTYDRYLAILFPLYVGTRKLDTYSHNLLFWLIGWGGRKAAPFEHWHRFLPFYAVYEHPGVRAAYAVLWPILTFGSEKLDSDDPVRRFLLWPLFGWQGSKSGKSHGWSVLWPFFQSLTDGDRFYSLDLLWPFFHYLRDDRRDDWITQWWLWPFVARTNGRYRQAWSFFWPLIVWRWFHDPGLEQHDRWVLPFYWHVEQALNAGGENTFTKLWPLVHTESRADGSGNWSVLSPWPWRQGNAHGVEEAYGFAWTLAAGRRYSATDRGMHLFANLYTQRRRGNRRYWSVPFLASYEGDEGSGTLRLLQAIPIAIGRTATEAAGR
ncbi:MAG: hypothetical protein R3F56_13895 [Planctomycetota bacterium]